MSFFDAVRTSHPGPRIGDLVRGRRVTATYNVPQPGNIWGEPAIVVEEIGEVFCKDLKPSEIERAPIVQQTGDPMTTPDDIRKQVISRVMQHMGWDVEKANFWYRTKNPMLGNVSPAFMVRVGRGAKLLAWLDEQHEETRP